MDSSGKVGWERVVGEGNVREIVGEGSSREDVGVRIS